MGSGSGEAVVDSRPLVLQLRSFSNLTRLLIKERERGGRGQFRGLPAVWASDDHVARALPTGYQPLHWPPGLSSGLGILLVLDALALKILMVREWPGLEFGSCLGWGTS